MASSRKIGTVYAELAVKDKMTVGMKRAQGAVDSLQKKFGAFAKGAALAIPAAAVAGLTAAMKSAIDAGGKLSDMMARTGASGEGLFVMQRAFENAGMAANSVPQALNKMQRELTRGNKAFQELGLNAQRLIGMDGVGAFKELSVAISRIPDPARRAALAMDIFGRSGAEMLVLMQDGAAFEVASKQVGGLGKTLADNAAALDKVSDSFGLFKIKAQQVGAELAVALLPHLESLADAMNEVDFSEMTSDAIGFTAALADMAKEALKVVDTLPGISQVGALMRAATMPIRAGAEIAARLNPVDGLALPTSEAWLGGNPLENYVEGIMLKDAYGSGIPELLKRRPEFAEGGDFDHGMGIPGLAAMFDMLTMIPREIAEEIAEAVPAMSGRDWESSAYGVNAYQRRGLSLDGSTAARDAKKVPDLLTQIRDILDGAKTSGQLIWP